MRACAAATMCVCESVCAASSVCGERDTTHQNGNGLVVLEKSECILERLQNIVVWGMTLASWSTDS
jgi:hypothetical protein